ncbi:FCGR2 protein, partial [Locustella ochotensis]|nr:FCGR2 protein [Locustella ochotensis]
GWCPLSPTGVPTSRLRVKPPWSPGVLWDQVTLTCQDSGTDGTFTWYKNGKRWWKTGPKRFTVTETGTFKCCRPDTKFSPSLTVLNDSLVLQRPVQALVEGDTATLRCRA